MIWRCIAHEQAMKKRQRSDEQAMKGSCLCGQVTYEADALAGPIFHCYCRTCRKAHSAAYATTARVDRSGFRWLRGDDVRASYESTPGKLRHFCPKCGSHLVAEWVDQPQVIIRVASLDDDPGSRPTARIWRSHAVDWLESGDDLPAFAEGPATGKPQAR